jgi:hypothetical protein
LIEVVGQIFSKLFTSNMNPIAILSLFLVVQVNLTGSTKVELNCEDFKDLSAFHKAMIQGRPFYFADQDYCDVFYRCEPEADGKFKMTAGICPEGRGWFNGECKKASEAHCNGRELLSPASLLAQPKGVAVKPHKTPVRPKLPQTSRPSKMPPLPLARQRPLVDHHVAHLAKASQDSDDKTSQNSDDKSELWNRYCHQPNGLYAVRNDCPRYVECFQGKAYARSCPLGTVFDPSQSRCEHESFAGRSDCQNLVKTRKIKCPDSGQRLDFGSHSRVVDPESCIRYYVCSSDGIPRPASCTPPLVFDEQTSFCKPQSLVPKCKDTYSADDESAYIRVKNKERMDKYRSRFSQA